MTVVIQDRQHAVFIPGAAVWSRSRFAPV